ncbi:HAMP domain-containing histidine kinase [Puia dinghuensis]|uniref:Uncharacterized protein n=1 Tax=Puia dinghuensis TaxID=1792502 RepID=A0A8J2UAT4_9BACT|nr:HAMP domain-containing histidine kinase [Puia dinghuensis]GGA90373.1 hypothetical protein GCM10011511_11990 [Puia dinghuensis]
MKTQFFASSTTLQRPLPQNAQTVTPPPAGSVRVSLHRMIDQLLAGLQPLALRHGNILFNGIPEHLAINADENMLAYVLGSMIHSAVAGRKNEFIQIAVLVAEDRTIICVKDVGTYYYHAISTEYRKIQYAAEKLGGSISVDNDDSLCTNVSFSISNRLLAA